MISVTGIHKIHECPDTNKQVVMFDIDGYNEEPIHDAILVNIKDTTEEINHKIKCHIFACHIINNITIDQHHVGL